VAPGRKDLSERSGFQLDHGSGRRGGAERRGAEGSDEGEHDKRQYKAAHVDSLVEVSTVLLRPGSALSNAASRHFTDCSELGRRLTPSMNDPLNRRAIVIHSRLQRLASRSGLRTSSRDDACSDV
jgi:hypothetical protein